MARAPEQSFPAGAVDEAALEGIYRFLSNPAVRYESLLESHYEATQKRMTVAGLALVIHDTTDFRFGGESERGLGRIQRRGRGFMGHFAIAASADGAREVLGVIGLIPVFRPEEHVSEHWRRRFNNPEKESRRWGDLVDQVHQRVLAARTCIHVMDREADSFELIAKMLEEGHRFVIRAARNRLTSDGTRVAEHMSTFEAVATREVSLSARKARFKSGKAHARALPLRRSRQAKIQIRIGVAEIVRPDRMKHVPATLKLNVIHVAEIDTPTGEEPVDWKLYTTERLETEVDALNIVDYYRARWLIEEFFKALKTGCGYERRQLETRHALLNALAISIPIAWTLLLLRQQARSSRDATTGPLTPRQLEVLRAARPNKLPMQPTPREILLAVASLGGHIKNNGEPGWLVLGRGLQRLLAYEVGWMMARCDQS
jgi:hypothetical protein